MEAPPNYFTLETSEAVGDILDQFGVRKTYGSLTFVVSPTWSTLLGDIMNNEAEKKKDVYEAAMKKKEKEAKQTHVDKNGFNLDQNEGQTSRLSANEDDTERLFP